MATSGKAWREAREKGIEFTFPSGNVAAVRPIEAEFFIQAKCIPDILAPLVTKYINGEMVVLDSSVRELLDQSEESLAFLDELTKYGFVNPKVVDAPQADDEIAIEDVAYLDKLFLYRYIFGRPAALLRQFRDKIIAMASVEPLPDDGRETEPDASDQPLGQPGDRNARHVDLASVR